MSSASIDDQKRDCPCSCIFIYGCVGTLLLVAGLIGVAAAIVIGVETSESWLVVAVVVLFALLLCILGVFACYLEPLVRRVTNRRDFLRV
jgi:ABC-type polysaccharide/polyol phosphate export permease